MMFLCQFWVILTIGNFCSRISANLLNLYLRLRRFPLLVSFRRFEKIISAEWFINGVVLSHTVKRRALSDTLKFLSVAAPHRMMPFLHRHISDCSPPHCYSQTILQFSPLLFFTVAKKTGADFSLSLTLFSPKMRHKKEKKEWRCGVFAAFAILRISLEGKGYSFQYKSKQFAEFLFISWFIILMNKMKPYWKKWEQNNITIIQCGKMYL